jgi:hypothetical protein
VPGGIFLLEGIIFCQISNLKPFIRVWFKIFKNIWGMFHGITKIQNLAAPY